MTWNAKLYFAHHIPLVINKGKTMLVFGSMCLGILGFLRFYYYNYFIFNLIFFILLFNFSCKYIPLSYSISQPSISSYSPRYPPPLLYSRCTTPLFPPQKRACLNWDNSQWRQNKNKKTRYKISYWGWSRLTNMRKSVSGPGKRVKDTLTHSHSQESHKNTKLKDITYMQRTWCRPYRPL